MNVAARAVRCAFLSLWLIGARASEGQDPRQLVARGLRAMGGVDAVRAMSGLGLEQQHATFVFGQNEWAEAPHGANFVHERSLSDYRQARRVVALDGRLITGARQHDVAIVADGIGSYRRDGQLGPASPGVVAGQYRALRRSVDRLLLAAHDDPSALTVLGPRHARGRDLDGVLFAGADTIALFFDRGSGLLRSSVISTDDPLLGVRESETWYGRWAAAGPILFPRQLDVFVRNELVAHTAITEVVANPALPDSAFAIPPTIRERAAGAAASTRLQVVIHPLAEGVWRLEGGSHHSLLVASGAELVVVELPQSTQRSRAVLDTIRANFPDRRLVSAVLTHHHSDHAGGLREYVAEGIPIVAHERHVEFARRVAAADRRLAPDLQARRRQPPILHAVQDSLVLGAGAHRVVLYHYPTRHADGLLLAWVPSAGLLFGSDVFTPGQPLDGQSQERAELAAFARARGIQPRRFAGGHGGIAEWRDVESVSGAAAISKRQ